jgi:pimeloyl-ACP methyl ester carboxylesterase
MATDIAARFLVAPTATRLQLVDNPDHAGTLRSLLGEPVFEEYLRLASRVRTHLGGGPTNLIFVPGVMGSMLLSESLGGVWWIDVRNRHHLDDLRLSPDGQNDVNPDYKLVPCTTDPVYEPFLTMVLGQDDFGHVTFPYDWRKPLAASADRLKELVERIWQSNSHKAVHLVAHSMGGLVVRSMLAKHGEALWSKLGRIVFIATPHYGSPAVAGYLKNHFWGFDLMTLLGLYLSRPTFRSLWGVLCMLPAPRGIYPGTRPGDTGPWSSGDSHHTYLHPCANFDLYRADAWHLDLTDDETLRLQAVLDGAASFHRSLYDAHQTLSQEHRDRMLVIAGVGYDTLFRLAYRSGVGRLVHFWDDMEKVTSRVQGDSHREGDGRVPLASAALEHVPIRYVEGVHGGLPNLPAVYGEVFRALKGERLQLETTPEGPFAFHLASPMAPSVAPHLDGTANSRPASRDPGYLSLQPPPPDRLLALRQDLETDRLPAFFLTRIF